MPPEPVGRRLGGAPEYQAFLRVFALLQELERQDLADLAYDIKKECIGNATRRGSSS
jgi:hypothetical protein